MSSMPSRLRNHFTLTVRRCNGPERKWPSMAAVEADSSRAMSKIWAAICSSM